MGRATAGSSAPARDATKIKASLKANGSAYNSAYKRLHQQLEHMYSQVEAAHRELMKSREHHKCLLEMVLHQDLVLQLLHGQLLTLAAQSGDPDRALTVWEAASQQSSASAAAGAGKPSNSHAAQPTPQPNTACSCSVTSMHELQQLVQLPPACEQQVQSVQAGLRTADSLQKASALPTEDNMETMHTQPQLVACSYAAHLLRTTTVEEFRCVTSMTVRDWQEQFHDLFLQLIVLLELVNRCSDLDAEDAPEQDGPPAAEAAAACQAPGGAADATAAGTRDAAGAAAAGQASHPLPATASGRAGPTSSMQQLEALVDTYVRRVLLAYLYNHMPLLEAVMTNYATKQPAVPRASHWERVAERMQLSELQLLHLAIAREEYLRLGRKAAAEGNALLSQAAMPSLFMAVAAVQEAAQNASGSRPAVHGSVHPTGIGRDAALSGTAVAAAGGATAAGDVSETQKSTGGGSLCRGLSAAAPGSVSGSLGVHAAAAACNGSEPAVQQAAEQQTASDAALADQLEDQLERHVRSRHLQLRMIIMFHLNTLTRLQIAQMVVSAFPYFPSTTELAAVAHKLWQNGSHQQVQGQQHTTQGKPAAQPLSNNPMRALFQQKVQQHSQLRSSVLQLQYLRCWNDVAEHGSRQQDSNLPMH